MKETDLKYKFEEINRKLDILIEEIELQKKLRREKYELKEDLMRVGKEVYESVVFELEEVHDHINTGDIFYLFKKLLRNVNNITKTFEQLENLRDFLKDFSPVSKELFKDFLNKLNDLDKKGYFEYSRELSGIVDRIITSFSIEDIKDLRNNIVTILNTVKNLTQPQMLKTINNLVNAFNNIDFEIKDKITYRKLIREFNQPEVKKGLFITLQILKNISNCQKE